MLMFCNFVHVGMLQQGAWMALFDCLWVCEVPVWCWRVWIRSMH